jgi:hypothetical protein
VVIVELMALRELLQDELCEYMAPTQRGLYDNDVATRLTEAIINELEEHEERCVFVHVHVCINMRVRDLVLLRYVLVETLIDTTHF